MYVASLVSYCKMPYVQLARRSWVSELSRLRAGTGKRQSMPNPTDSNAGAARQSRRSRPVKLGSPITDSISRRSEWQEIHIGIQGPMQAGASSVPYCRLFSGVRL